MKKVAFAWISMWIDFSTIEEAIKYIKDNNAKGWRFEQVNESDFYKNPYSNPECYIGENGNDELPYTVKVEKPYKNYNMG